MTQRKRFYYRSWKREIAPPEREEKGWIIRGRGFPLDQRARTELVVAYGNRDDRTGCCSVSLRIDDRLVVLGVNAVNQLALLLIDANQNEGGGRTR